MKKVVFIIFSLCSCLLYSNDLSRRYLGSLKTKEVYSCITDLRFDKDSYDLSVELPKGENPYDVPDSTMNIYNEYEENGTFDIKEEGGLEYMYFTPNTGFNLIKKCGMLNYGKILYLIKGRTIFFDSFFVDRDPPFSPYMKEYTINSSSFLTEKDTKYDGSTFYYNNDDLTPWVEGVKGDGKGEWVELDFSLTHSRYYPNCIVDAFLFSNGYVNSDKPYLYKANNRVKTLRVICQERDIDMCVELEDTSKFQLITLPKNLGNEPCKVRFIIEDVYKGNKWDDTVINRIIPISKDYIFDK